jgi:hypothetical protein
MERIPNDVAGCNGERCDRREKCLRYVGSRHRGEGDLYCTWVFIQNPKDCKYFEELT